MQLQLTKASLKPPKNFWQKEVYIRSSQFILDPRATKRSCIFLNPMKTLAIGSGLLCAAALLGAIASPASAGNLVVNGGFESASLNNGQWTLFDSDDNDARWNPLEGWTSLEGSRIEIRNNVAGTAYEGKHFAELDSHFNRGAEEVGFFQEIATEIGQKYTLSFAYGPREQKRVDGDNKLEVFFGDFSKTFDAGNSTDGWKTFSETITATSTTTTLKFLARGVLDTYGANVDDVSVSTAVDVPEPFSLLGIAVVGGIGAASALRKRAGEVA